MTVSSNSGADTTGKQCRVMASSIILSSPDDASRFAFCYITLNLPERSQPDPQHNYNHQIWNGGLELQALVLSATEHFGGSQQCGPMPHLQVHAA